uniref:Uncharacterized protein n=1 Tax=Amphimedon queenslandica TaxID=400682 RepID=A0A1X7V2H2_AMPQE
KGILNNIAIGTLGKKVSLA